MENDVLEKTLIDDVLKSAQSENFLENEEEVEMVRFELKDSIENMCRKIQNRYQLSEEATLQKLRAKKNFGKLVKEVKDNMDLMLYFRVSITEHGIEFYR